MPQYEDVLRRSGVVRFGTRNATPDGEFIEVARSAGGGKPQLVLSSIKEFHREYEWVS
jgi:polyketide biosynthesis 3-hydroxy-3-methylglutaryl-CoA synthase-like enzyme PksG